MNGVTTSLEELLALRYVANQLHLPQQKITANSQQGNYQSPLRGRGMDFVETRVYQPGDDIRTINWAVTARTGKPHTKIYQQERERPVYIIIDFSPSMFFGTRNAFKSVVAARAAALIAWAALKNGDRIGTLLIKNTFQILPPCQRKQNLIEVLKQVVKFVQLENQGVGDYTASFNRLKKMIKSGSQIYFISDFYSFNESIQTDLQQLAKKNEVINILISDNLEKNPPEQGKYLFHDSVKKECLMTNTSNKSFCANYREIYNKRFTALKKLCYATGMNLVELCTTDDLVSVMRQVLNRKK